MRSIGCRLHVIPVLLGLLFFAAVASAQEDQEERSRFVRFVERQISTPDRLIRLGRIDGALSSDVQIDSITIADREGVWLRIEGVHLIWNRRALLGRRLEIALLEAEQIAILRAPIAAGSPSEPFEPADFALPELPVVLDVDTVRVPRVDIAAGVVSAQAYELSVTGSVALDDGVLDAGLDIERLDGSGTLDLEAEFSNATQILALNLSLSEPEDGIVANLLGLEGRPAVSFAIEGTGPLSDFSADIALAADGEQLLSGTAAIAGAPADGFRFVADVGGDLQRLVPPRYGALVDAGSRLTIDATRSADGTLQIAAAELRTGAVTVQFSGALTAQGIPAELELQATLAAPDGALIDLPTGGRPATVQSGLITASLAGETGAWTARFELKGLSTPMISARDAVVTAEGTVNHLADPTARRLTFQVQGVGSEIDSGLTGVAEFLGADLRIEASGAWTAGGPVQVAGAQVESDNFLLGFEGSVDAERVEGDLSIEVHELSPFSALAGRPLAGASALSASGSAAFSGMSFTFALDGEAENLDVGIAPLTGLLQGRSTITGTVARSDAELRLEALRIENSQMALRANGGLNGPASHIDASFEIADVAALTGAASGGVSGVATIAGGLDVARVEAQLHGEDLVVGGRPFTGTSATFTGTIGGADLNGSLALAGDLDGVRVEVNAEVAALPDGRRELRNLRAAAGETTLTGELARLPAGLYTGSLVLRSVDVSEISPLLLMDASGAVSAEIRLYAAATQSAEVVAEIGNFAIAGIAGDTTLGSADIDLSIEDAFGDPLLEGTLSGTDLRVGDFVLPAVKLDAERSGDTTAWNFSAELAAGSLAAGGTLARTADASLATIETLQISAESFEAQLAAPVEVAVGGGQVTVSEGVVEAGGGRIALSGQLGDRLAIHAQMDALPLAILNPFQPDLEASGTLFGTLGASGTAKMPEVIFDVEARDVSFALLQLTGIDPLHAEAEGRYAAGTLSLDAGVTISGRVVSLRGDIGEELDVTVGVDDLPLSLVHAVAPQLELGGTLSARLHATGSLADPQANFVLNGADLTLAQLRAAGVPGVDLFATGRIEDTALELSEAVVTLDGGRVELSGTVGDLLDLQFGIHDLPLSLAGGQLPGLGLDGTLTGSGTATGAALDPQVVFELRGEDIATAHMRAAGAPRIEVSARGSYAAGLVQLSEAVASMGEGRIDLAGTVGSELDVDATVTALPLTLVGALFPIDLEGSLSGTAQASGRLHDPRASFDLRGEGITTPELRSDGLPDLAVSLQGGYAAGTATLTEAVVAAGEGRMSVSGTVGSEVDLSATAQGFPLWIARAVMPDLDLDGTVAGSLTAQGSLAAPQASFDLQATGVTAAPLQAAQLQPAEAVLVGSYDGGIMVLETAMVELGNGQMRLEGMAGQDLDLTLTLADFPAAAANAVWPGLGLTGALWGTISASGPSADPSIGFALSGAHIHAAPLRRGGE